MGHSPTRNNSWHLREGTYNLKEDEHLLSDGLDRTREIGTKERSRDQGCAWSLTSRGSHLALNMGAGKNLS